MKVKKIISIIFYVIATFFLLLYGVVEILPHLSLSETGRLFLLCGSCLFLFVGGVLWSECAENNKAVKINLWRFFVLYLIFLIRLTLFYARNMLIIEDTVIPRYNFTKDYIKLFLEVSMEN